MSIECKGNKSTYPRIGDTVVVRNYSKGLNGKTGIVTYINGSYIGVSVDESDYELYPCEVTVDISKRPSTYVSAI